MNRVFVFMVLMAVVACRNKPKEQLGENEFYVCSMDPQVMEKQMGMCPICKMPLAKVTIDRTQLHVIRLNEEQIKLANIKTDTARMDSIWDERTLTGTFKVNANSIQQVASRLEGRIEKLYFRIPGQEIKRGDLIYEVYSRELFLAQEEYLFTLEKSKTLAVSALGKEMIQSAKNKLLLKGLGEQQIVALAKSKRPNITIGIYSNSSGTITEIPVREGDYVMEGSIIYQLADLSTLWVEAQVYSYEYKYIEENKKLQIIPQAFPEESMEGEIDFVNPELQSNSKINLIRIKVPNARKQFLPGMMAFVVLKSSPHPAITVPPDAVIQDGKKSHVWIRNSQGGFEARRVKTGLQTKSEIEITSGLNVEEVVVTSGAYLIYSDYVFKRGAYPLSDSISNPNIQHEHAHH